MKRMLLPVTIALLLLEAWGVPPISLERANGQDRAAKEAAIVGKPPLVQRSEGDGKDLLHSEKFSGARWHIEGNGIRIPVVAVRGTPYEMGMQLGSQMRDEMQRLVPPLVVGFRSELKVSEEQLDHVWATTSSYTDPRVMQQLVGLAEGSGIPIRTLQHVHCLPLLMPYSCSSIAAWGDATVDGHLYQTRNLDWSLEAGAHEFPVLVVYFPDTGIPHVSPSFAGFIGAHCGMNAAGIVLSEIGDASAKEMPYETHAPHFTAWFRTLLYDANSLTEAIRMFEQIKPTKSYHFVFGDGVTDKRSTKIRAATGGGRAKPEIDLWKDNDPKDELAPQVLSCVVYHDEGRGAFPTLAAQRGKLDAEKLIALANQIPIKGGNVMNAVFDATGMRLWVSYAGQGKEAYQRPYLQLDLMTIDIDRDGKPDWRPSP